MSEQAAEKEPETSTGSQAAILTTESPARFQIQDHILTLEADLSKMHPFFAQGMMRHMGMLVEAWYAKRAREQQDQGPKFYLPGINQAKQAMKNFVLKLKH